MQNSKTSLTRLLVLSSLMSRLPTLLPIPPTTANLNVSHSSMHQPSIFLALCNLTPHFPSPFHPHSSYSSRLFLLNTSGITGKTFVKNSIQGILQLRYKNVIAIVAPAVNAQLLPGRTTYSTFEIPILCVSPTPGLSQPKVSWQSTL